MSIILHTFSVLARQIILGYMTRFILKLPHTLLVSVIFVTMESKVPTIGWPVLPALVTVIVPLVAP